MQPFGQLLKSHRARGLLNLDLVALCALALSSACNSTNVVTSSAQASQQPVASTSSTVPVTCDVTQYGAKGDGKTLNTIFLQKAIDDCEAKGGGTVSIPVDPSGGLYISGMITLKSNITLTIAKGATLKGSLNDSDYPTQIPDPNNSQVSNNCQKALIYANGAKNITISGEGTIDGSGENPNWLNLDPVKSPDYLEKMRPMAVYLTQSTNVTVQDVTIFNAAMWAFVNLENSGVHINHVTVNSNNPNSRTRDGMDIVDSQNVLIENSTVTSEDDAICLKSGLVAGAPYSGVSDVTVRNSTILKSQVANGLKLGTASTGPFQNITFDTINVQGVQQAAMAVESVDGGSISNIAYKNITIKNTGAVAYVVLAARGKNIGSVNGVTFDTITASNLTQKWGSAVSGSIIDGQTYAVQNLSFSNMNVTALGGITAVPAIPPEYTYNKGQYPDPRSWGNLPAFGFYVRHAQNVQFTNVTNQVSPADARQAIEVSPDVTGSGF